MAAKTGQSNQMMLGDFSKGSFVVHKCSEEVKYRVIGFNKDSEGNIVEVKLYRVGGPFNRSTPTIEATSTDYIQQPGRAPSKAKIRARARAAGLNTNTSENEVIKDTGVEEKGPNKTVGHTKPSEEKSIPKKSQTPAQKKSSGSKSKGKHSRGAISADISEMDLDPRNMFLPHTRLYAYFQALLNGEGKAAYGDMVSSCIELNEQFKIGGDSEAAIRRDLTNQVSHWRKGEWQLTVIRDDSACETGKGGSLGKRQVDLVVYTVTHVKGTPWDEFIKQ